MIKVAIHYILISSLVVTSAFAGPSGTAIRPQTSTLLDTSSEKQEQIINDYDQYLQQLGLEDYSGKAQQTLNNESTDELEKSVLQQNVKEYQIVNTARELTTLIMSRALPQMMDTRSSGHYRAEEIQEKLVKLTGQLLDLRRLEGMSEVPVEVETITSKPEGAKQQEVGEVKVNMLNREGNIKAIDNANYSKNQIVTNILDTLYGTEKIETIMNQGSANERQNLQKEIAQIESLVKKYVFEMYENKSLGSTRWLGRGLVYSLVRFSRLQNEQRSFGSDTETKLASHLRETYADNLNNYIKAQITTVDAKGNKVNLKIETGSIINESAKNGREGFAKGSAVFPKFFKNPGAYMRMIFKGLWVFPPLYFFTTDSEITKDKIRKGQKITFSDRFLHAFDQTKWVLSGSFANSAQAIVHEVEVIPGKSESKVEAVLLTEFNQNRGAGGVRWVGLEGFGFMNPAYASFSVTNFDAAKMQEEGRNQLDKGDKPFILWEGDRYVWSQEAEKFQKVGDAKTFLEIEEKEQREILSMLTQMSASEYKKKYQERLIKTWRDWTYGKNAKAYALNYIDSAKAFYGSLGVRLAIRKAGFVDPVLESRFSIFHKFLQKLKYTKVQELNFEKPLTSPNFAAVNTKLIKNSSIFHEDGLTKFLQPGWNAREFETALKQTSPKRESFSPRLQRILSTSMKQNFKHGLDSFPSSAAFYVDTYAYGNVIRDLTIRGVGISMYATGLDESTIRESRKNNASTLLADNEIDATAVSKNTDQAWEKEIREFMFDYGFDDKAQKIRERIKKQPVAEHELARVQQLENIKSFEGNNAARELAILFFSRVKNRLNDSKQVNLINDLVARTLTLQPKNLDRFLTPEELVEVNKLKDLPEESEEATKYKNEQLVRRYRPIYKRAIEETTKSITSEYLSVIYGDNVDYYLDHENDKNDTNDAIRRKARQQIQADAERIFSLAARFTERLYMDTQTGSTRWLGRAMLLVLSRIGEKAQPDVHYLETKLLKNLKKHLEFRSIDLEQFIGDKVVVLNKDKKYQKIPVNTGDFAGYISYNAEAGAIAYGWQPGDTKRAKEHGLIGNLLDSASFIEEEALVKDGFTLGKKIFKASNRGGFGSLLFGKARKGISHIGYFKVLGPAKIKEQIRRTDSKIQVVYVEDNFPSPVADTTESMVRPGGARFTGPETFNDSAHDTHITIGQVNHAKMGKLMLEKLNELIKSGKYVKNKGDVVFKSHPINLDEKGEPTLPEIMPNGEFAEPKGGWRMESDPQLVINKKNEIESRLRNANTQKERLKIYTDFALWLQNGVDAKRSELIERGLIFMWISPRGTDYFMASYCSLYELIGWLITHGIDAELVPDKGAPLTQKLFKIGKWANKNMKQLPKFAQKWIKTYLNIGAVKNAMLLNKLPRVLAPAGWFNQPYVDKSGLHTAQLIRSGLSNILKTTTGEFFERTPKVREPLSNFLSNKKIVAVKSIDDLTIIGAVGHSEELREVMNADNGVSNTEEIIEKQEELRKSIKKPKFLEPTNSVQRTCPAVFKTAG